MTLRPIVLLLFAAASFAVTAAERTAYKHVDEKGNITYSQTPPTGDAKKIDISPAHQGRGGQVNLGRIATTSNYGDDRRDAARQRKRQQEEAQKNRVAQLEAECNRQRGTDCKNPDTLRLMDSQQIPRRGR